MSGEALMLSGKPTGRYKQGTIILLTRRARSKWWKLVCIGQKGHYAKDGSCAHTDLVLARLRPERVPVERVRVVGWGDA